MSPGVLEALAPVLDTGADADDVLRSAVGVLVAEPSIVWAGIRFIEEGELVLGPFAGEPDEARRLLTPIVYRGDAVGELVVDGEADGALLEQFALLISPYVLLGWDTGGEAWVP